MKNKIRIETGMVFIALLLMLSSQVCAAPPDMSQWVGKWFSLKTKQNGTGFDTSVSKFFKDSVSESAYINIWNWDPINQEFQFDLCQLDKTDGKWSVEENLIISFLTGTNVKFLWSYDSLDKDGNKEGTVFTAVMEGREKNGMLQSANIKTLGGAIVNIYDDTKVSAGSFTVTGKMIASSKVPVDCSVIQH